jgi:hypothetical protein
MKYIARVYVPMYLELEAESEEDAQQVAEQWYKEQKKTGRNPQSRLCPQIRA